MLPPETEEHIVTQAKRGDRHAQRRLYDLYAPLATAITLRYVASGDEARDVLQDCFLKIFSQIDRFQYRGEGSLRAWIGRLAANNALDHLRQSQRIAFTDHLPDPPDEEPDIGRVSDQRLFELIQQLPDGCRTVLNLFVFEQLSHKEIARQLGIKPDTSASQFAYAKKLLARMIKRQEHE